MTSPVPEPILGSPFLEPAEHWRLDEEEPRRVPGRRPAARFPLVNRIRERLASWRAEGYPGATRTTLELLRWWGRDGRERPLFFAQIEAAETIIFLVEARSDFLQGIEVPREDAGFPRRACKMATGAGKTTVMGMLAAWSIINKAVDRRDPRFSETVLVVAPNVTVRERLRELRPEEGDGSIYRSRDLVPPHLLPLLHRGRIVVSNWHAFEPHAVLAGGVAARVVRAGVPVRGHETIRVGSRTAQDIERLAAVGRLKIVEERRDAGGKIEEVVVETVRHVESDAALVNRVLGREGGLGRNVLVLNDEAHHAYRPTVWIDGLDRLSRVRGINLCVDFSATPFFPGPEAEVEADRPFPWIVSEFGLADAIESGLVKIPRPAALDPEGEEIPGADNLWRWVLSRLSPSERAGRGPRPEAVLRHAARPLAQLAALRDRDGQVLIIVCRDTALARAVHEWIAEGRCPEGVPPAGIEALRNRDGAVLTLRADSRVSGELDDGGAVDDETRWMRLCLQTVGMRSWPEDRSGRPILPEGFEELARRLGRRLDPPGRDVRCIVSVGMLNEGWDCRTVTHIAGLRPFASGLLCEQVVGRALRRTSYEAGPGGMFAEEAATVLGVPFEAIPCRASRAAPAPPPGRRRIRALPERSHLEIRFPRVEGYARIPRWRLALETGRPRWPPAPPASQRPQAALFDLAAEVTRGLVARDGSPPPHVLFPRVLAVLRDEAGLGASVEDFRVDWDVEAPEVPLLETGRESGSTADVDFWTAREVMEVAKCHVNRVVADPGSRDEAAARALDGHPAVEAFARNEGLGLAIPSAHGGPINGHKPDFIIRLAGPRPLHLLLDLGGPDPAEDGRREAAARWVAAVNAEGAFGRWAFASVREAEEIDGAILGALREISPKRKHPKIW